MNKLSKITLGIGGISLLTAITHKLLINDFETYRLFTGMAIIPFLLFLLFIIIHLFYGIFANLFKKKFKEILISLLISLGFFALWVVIMMIDKELFVYAT